MEFEMCLTERGRGLRAQSIFAAEREGAGRFGISCGENRIHLISFTPSAVSELDNLICY